MMPMEAEMTSSSLRLEIPNQPNEDYQSYCSDDEIWDVCDEHLTVGFIPF